MIVAPISSSRCFFMDLEKNPSLLNSMAQEERDIGLFSHVEKILPLASICLLLISCHSDRKPMEDTPDYAALFLTDKVPNQTPISFMESLVPDEMLIHRGVFSPDLSEFYYTLSDWNYEQFTTKVIKKVGGAWSESQDAFFNTEFNEHGMSFTPDGSQLFFSSTRPVGAKEGDSIPNTWHIWRSEKVGNNWSEPEFVDIPNLRDRLVSHPTISSTGTIYFHSSKLDYTEMTLYATKEVDGKFQTAKKLTIDGYMTNPKTTAFIAPDESYLLFASVENQLFMTICFPDGKGNWIGAKKLHHSINANAQGNPYVTPDGQFLFYASNENTVNEDPKWRIKSVNMDVVPVIKKVK